MEPEDHPGFDYTFDLENRVAIYRDGYHATITDMLDEDHEHTFDLEEVAIVCFRLPGDGGKVSFNLRAYEESLQDPDSYESEH